MGFDEAFHADGWLGRTGAAGGDGRLKDDTLVVGLGCNFVGTLQ
jgi:hypothetical protein